LIRVGSDFEVEYPDARALATECYANFWRTADMLMELHNRQTRDEYGLSPNARQILAVVEGAGEPLEPSVIAERLLTTTGTMTSLLDTLEKRGLIQRLAHPNDRRKLLVAITPAAQTIIDALLPSLHARERAVMSDALTISEQRQLLQLIAKLQQAAIRASSEPPAHGARRVRPDPPTSRGTRP
jgi:DNA-binding MarR family transcriptional regulator